VACARVERRDRAAGLMDLKAGRFASFAGLRAQFDAWA
jgi:hypothetical protein